MTRKDNQSRPQRVHLMEVTMTVKEYLNQAYRLDKRIKSDLLEIERLKEMSLSVSAINYDKDYVQTSRSTEAYFVKCLSKIEELQREIDAEVRLLLALKVQIRELISGIEDTDQEMVLRYRYLHNFTWERIGQELFADSRTIRRWHKRALDRIKVPENPIVIS